MSISNQNRASRSSRHAKGAPLVQCSFRADDGTTGHVKLLPGTPEWVGGQLIATPQYDIRIGKQRIQGALYNYSEVKADHSLSIQVPVKDLNQGRIPAGMPAARIQIDLTTTDTVCRVTINSDLSAMARGPITATSDQEGFHIERYQRDTHQPSDTGLTQLVTPPREPLITPVTSFKNLSAIMWIHTLEMVPEAGRVIEEIVHQKQPSRLILHMENIFNNAHRRADYEARVNTLAQPDLPDMANSLNEKDYLAQLLLETRRSLSRHGCEVNLKAVDIDRDTTSGSRSEEFWDRSRSKGVRLLRSTDLTPQALFARVQAQLGNRRAAFDIREEHVRGELSVACAAPENGTHHILLMGAGHESIMRHLPGAELKRCIVSPALKAGLGARAVQVLNRIGLIEHAEKATDQMRVLREVLAQSLVSEIETRMPLLYARLLDAKCGDGIAFTNAFSACVSARQLTQWGEQFLAFPTVAEARFATETLFKTLEIPDYGDNRILQRVGKLIRDIYGNKRPSR